jgi:antitoxin (DNA-binding transcriptional repressor) of toxin-antitoxin stability system
MKALTATELRSRLYKVLDEVAESGVPYEVRHRGRVLLVVPADPPVRKLDTLPQRKVLRCSVDELVGTSWAESWASSQTDAETP